jgi:hypothetical protein
MAGYLRIRLGEGKAGQVRCTPPVAERRGADSPAAAAGAGGGAGVAPPAAPAPRFGRQIIALVEAVPAGADALALALAGAVEQAGQRVSLVSLDRANRLGQRLGVPAPAPAWQWKQASPELLVRQGLRLLVPGPSAETEVGHDAVEGVLHLAREAADIVVVDLGCRWEPRLFRPVLLRADAIWIVTRAGQWTGTEMRLEQAEFSGWTEMRRVRLVVIGDGPPPPVGLGVQVAGTLSEPAGEAARDFAVREVGRLAP